jgi:hypothetical protein
MLDEFQYKMKLAELESLTTNKSKSKFISDNRVDWAYKLITAYDILLMQTMFDSVLMAGVVGQASLRTSINEYITNVVGDLSPLEGLPHSLTTAHNTYNDFMQSPGIPAYMKLAILKLSTHSSSACRR